MQQVKEKEVIEHISSPKTKVRDPDKSYVEGLKSIESCRFNKSKKKLPDIIKIGGVAPITGRKRNLMKCTQTIQPTTTKNGQKKSIGRENEKKRAGTSVQGIVKTQLEILELGKFSLCPYI